MLRRVLRVLWVNYIILKNTDVIDIGKIYYLIDIGHRFKQQLAETWGIQEIRVELRVRFLPHPV